MPRKTFTFDGRRYDVRAATEEELIAKVAIRKRDLEEGRRQITRNMLVADWAVMYLESYRRPAVSDVT